MSTAPDSDGPTPHAVSLARNWLNIGGLAWLALAAAMLVATRGSDLAPVAALAALAIVHFIVARYGSRRVAVFFAMFGPP